MAGDEFSDTIKGEINSGARYVVVMHVLRMLPMLLMLAATNVSPSKVGGAIISTEGASVIGVRAVRGLREE
jgi:hypothetical protein